MKLHKNETELAMCKALEKTMKRERERERERGIFIIQQSEIYNEAL